MTVSLLFYLPVCLSVAYSGNAAKAKRIKRGSAHVAVRPHSTPPAALGSVCDIEVKAMPADGGRKKVAIAAVTPVSSASATTVTQTWEGGAATRAAVPTRVREACMEPVDACMEPVEDELCLPAHTSEGVAVQEEEGQEEHDVENPRQQVASLGGEQPTETV